MASQPRIALRLMNGGAYNPSRVTDHLLSAGGVTQVVQKNVREVEFLTEVDTNERLEGMTVAKFRQKLWSVVFEPLVEGVTVEPSIHSHQSGAVEVPEKALVFLRQKDTIRFRDQGLAIEIDGLEESQRLQRGAEDEVQVKSSNVEPEPVTSGEDNEADSSEDEDDLDRSSSARSQRTPNEITPATSKPTEKFENLDTIKETPSRVAYMNSTGDDQPYSTAPGTLLDSHEMTMDASSPSVQAQQRSNPESQVRAGNSLINTFESTPSDQDEDIDDEKPIALRKKQVTYGRQVQNKRGATVTDTEQIGEVATSAEPEDNLKVDDGKDEIDVEETDAPTSDALSLHEIVSTAAIRTTSTGSQKRKSSDRDVEAERDSINVRKKQKTAGDSVSPELPVNAEDELEPNGLSEAPRKSRQKSRKKGRLTAPRKTLRSLQQTPESGEEIAVLQKSPEVVIKPHLRGDTPSSSAPSTVLTGKVPKLLLSSDCKAQSKPAVKQLLREAGATIVKEVPSRRTHFVCVVTKQHSLKSAKVLLSLLRGKLIVDEQWLVKSAEAGELLDPADFVHHTLEDSITHDRRRVFAGKHLFFTHEAVSNYKDGWSDIQEVAKGAGASEVAQIAFNRPSYQGDRDDVVFFGIAKGDKDLTQLINDHGRTVYNKDLFTDSILAGGLELTDEGYKLSASVPTKKARR